MIKKTLISSAFSMTTLGSVNAQADIAVTNMMFDSPTYGITGTLLTGGGGTLHSTAFFFGHTFNMDQETAIIDNNGSWSGPGIGYTTYNYDATIQGMTSQQRAVGILFNWNTTTTHVLEVFDCNDDGSGEACSGNGIPWQDGCCAGAIAVFNGVEVVPLPATAWLMGSGLLGIVSVARRRKQRLVQVR